MATRTIVTSQPDVACDVCERRLLRGEQPDVFLAAGRRRTVCELCAPRAAHEGWLRETDSQSLSLPPMRARRGRSLLDRLRQVGRPAGAGDGGLLLSGADGREAQRYDLFADSTHAEAHTVNGTGGPASAQPVAAGPSRPQPDGHTQPAEAAPSETLAEAALPDHDPLAEAVPEAALPPQDVEVPVGEWSDTGAEQQQPSSYVEQAIAVFNASEFPRRVAGVTRSLGAPAVNVRSAEHLSSVVSIVVAWELCWYRYEVDLSEPVVEAQVIAQGTELAELAREDRLANAAAGESGTLALSSV